MHPRALGHAVFVHVLQVLHDQQVAVSQLEVHHLWCVGLGLEGAARARLRLAMHDVSISARCRDATPWRLGRRGTVHQDGVEVEAVAAPTSAARSAMAPFRRARAIARRRRRRRAPPCGQPRAPCASAQTPECHSAPTCARPCRPSPTTSPSRGAQTLGVESSTTHAGRAGLPPTRPCEPGARAQP